VTSECVGEGARRLMIQETGDGRRRGEGIEKLGRHRGPES
jgi:hypothetical protein